MRKITAKHESTCKGCGKPIHIGMELYWERGKGTFHTICWDSRSSNEEDSPTYTESVYSNHDRSEIAVPRFLQAREKYRNYQVRFVESLAIPEEFLAAIDDETITRDELSFYCQWRVDFPADSNLFIDDKKRKVLLVAHKILTRGRITLVSPFLEEKIRKHFEVSGFTVDKFRQQNYLYLCNYLKETNIWVDSHSEKKFLDEILYKELGPFYRHFVLPQVHLSSLVPEVEGNESFEDQRIDFLITTKDKRIVVELDGPDHIGHEDRDRARDELLIRWGYEVLRIPNDELESGDGLNLQDLRELLSQTEKAKVDDLSAADKYANAIKLSHQLQIVAVEALLSGALNFDNCNNVYLDIDFAVLSSNDVLYILNESIIDLCNFLKKLAKLYNCDLNGEKILNSTIYKDSCKASGIVISFGEDLSSSLPCFFVQDITFPA